MALMTCEEFRYARDRYALDGCYQRWPALYAKKKDLWQQIKEVNHQLSVKHAQHLEDEKKALWWKFQDVAGELSALKVDAKVRYARLHEKKDDPLNSNIAAWDNLMSALGRERKVA